MLSSSKPSPTIMRLFLSLPLLLTLVWVESAQGAWHLVWSDEFNGTKVNDNEWYFETSCAGQNREEECYTAHRNENVHINNGHLIITAKPENYKGFHFTSGRIHSKKAWTYGKFEARAKMPSGHQLWPAIWMMPRDSKYGQWAASGEIDIMEYDGDRHHETIGSIHYGGTAPCNTLSNSGWRKFSQDFSAGFHTFGLEWEKHEIRWYVDGQLYHKENINRNMFSHKCAHNPYHANGEPFDQPFYWILNVAVGGTFFGNGPYVTPEQAKHWKNPHMAIDWVRVYQQK